MVLDFSVNHSIARDLDNVLFIEKLWIGVVKIAHGGNNLTFSYLLLYMHIGSYSRFFSTCPTGSEKFEAQMVQGIEGG